MGGNRGGADSGVAGDAGKKRGRRLSLSAAK